MKQAQLAAKMNDTEAVLSTSDVLFSTLPTEDGRLIGHISLNCEAALNALNLEMAAAMLVQLGRWKLDPSIVCVVLEGAGEKAFCAGGDVRAIYHAGVKAPEEVTQEAMAFFEQEYRLDYLLHTFGKPVIVWGDGIVMGGGLGLMMGASHRIVTERSRIAMPEVTIGLYPDVGGSYFLNRMPGKVGLFLGLTAYQMNTADALYVGIGRHSLRSQDKMAMLEALKRLPWQSAASDHHQMLDTLFGELQSLEIGQSVLRQQRLKIDALMAGELSEIVNRAKNEQPDDIWLQKALHTFLKGSPLSWSLIYAQSQLSAELSLADIFQFELGLSANCSAFGDFKEGVRALLIDKDRTPLWQFPQLDEHCEAAANRLLTSPWENQIHPLGDLS
ncbi:enoyl-CoA hydratase/isomerase family protein [Shewanella surugensis]|uniref:3-hydroxyisobutyryl-CoA hydrolase n=1 Tax=Shewanella surugensis TaxID=212020 RepID=A0ABT0LI49_9GAMM|nr:enoyl-CoA hydratase/isomerase family protein [Shewanella surugensis]MCL1127254.1 enoyl-CoA hydratase/isomerase family protein [Shewanella surugensis]